MELKDLKIPKKLEKELKKSVDVCGEPDLYPYGTRVTLDTELMAKFPGLENVKAGDKVKIAALGEVIMIRKVDRRGDRKKDWSVEIQLQKMGIDTGSEKPKTLIDSIEASKKGQK